MRNGSMANSVYDAGMSYSEMRLQWIMVVVITILDWEYNMRILLMELVIDHCRILKKDSYILLKPRIGPRLPEKTLSPRQLYRAFDYS